jgi:2,4-dienoyl-CoA reductase-like NADH-dependent reductase (Old Yellow Enzyme family)
VAERVRRETGLPVASGWCIDAPNVAERVVADGQMDVVMIGRAILADPHYPYKIASELGEDNPSSVLPTQYAYWLSRYQGPGKASAQ